MVSTFQKYDFLYIGFISLFKKDFNRKENEKISYKMKLWIQ